MQQSAAKLNEIIKGEFKNNSKAQAIAGSQPASAEMRLPPNKEAVI
jgi:hypothetical protein